MQSKKYAAVDKNVCVACGSCVRVCPIGAISVYKGSYAEVNAQKCVGCGRCANICPAGCIEIKEREAV